MAKSRSGWTLPAALALLVLALASTGWFGLRTYGSFLLLRSAYQLGVPEISSIRAWMTLHYVATTYRVPDDRLLAELGLPAQTSQDASLRSLAEQHGSSRFQYVQRVQQTVVAIGPRAASFETHAASNWVDRIGEQALSTLLIFGYPALGLTLVLGAIGLPLPTGLATLVAGSLSALGRMNWAWAAAIAITASVVGDVIAYALGHFVGRGFLARRGRWLGYTPELESRVQRYFERWGGLTILLSRTLASHLSSAVSLLGGMSRYRVLPFLLFAVPGRVIWTVIYLGLGYGIGGNLEAASDFLTNLSGLLLSFAVLVAAGAVASPRLASAARRYSLGQTVSTPMESAKPERHGERSVAGS